MRRFSSGFVQKPFKCPLKKPLTPPCAAGNSTAGPSPSCEVISALSTVAGEPLAGSSLEDCGDRLPPESQSSLDLKKCSASTDTPLADMEVPSPEIAEAPPPEAPGPRRR
eukprot:RCo044045